MPQADYQQRSSDSEGSYSTKFGTYKYTLPYFVTFTGQNLLTISNGVFSFSENPWIPRLITLSHVGGVWIWFISY
jgi:hypothetical protein